MTPGHAAATHVVAAVLEDAAGRVLLAQRPDDKDFGGLWEFPGGKVEPGESATAALRRELHEELGIDVEPSAAAPLLRVPWRYPHKSILLDVYKVTVWGGEPHSREGQPIAWYAPTAMQPALMPPADHPVLTALRLPPVYAISPEPGDPAVFLGELDATLARGVRLVQLRARAGDDARLAPLAAAAQARVRAVGGRLLLNARVGLAQDLGCDGVHLTAAQLTSLRSRPLPPGAWVGASCHDADELEAALRLGCDFVVLGPVRPTPSHPGRAGLGWEAFAALAATSPLPVYALGGVGPDDLAPARAAGAFGVAGISRHWGA